MAPLPENMVVAMAYVPFQQFSKVYTPEKALDNGTLFPELDKPFYGRQVEPR
ncbi:spore coat associated protein CotJA [Clostridiales bacterium NSJ-40]|uniref:Spore coat associated protein CotJA n=2 Tax=Yeguia hominis TaxID=2763662 RepID=A0A926DCG3_9FIRM|nr:spore coat associated protein CotJA [Yeguia hominis]